MRGIKRNIQRLTSGVIISALLLANVFLSEYKGVVINNSIIQKGYIDTKQEVKKISKNKSINHMEDTIKVKGSSDKLEKKNSSISTTWNLKSIHVDKVKDRKNEKKIKVALLDSGVDYIKGITVKEKINFVENEESSLIYEDYSSHGTTIASVMVADENARVSGINKNIELYSAKVLDQNCEAPITRVIKGIYWAIDKKVNIISISFGTDTYSKKLEEAINAAYDQGILIIAAVGNRGEKENGVEYPAAFEHVLGVGSVDAKGELSDYSSRGKGVDIVAPGEAISATGAFGEEMITWGTSMAVPHVVGVASLLWERNLKKSNDFIEKLILESARELGDKKEYGSGLVDYEYANSVYDVAERQYENQKQIEIKDNNTEIEKYNNSENENKVEGSWYEGVHTAIFKDKGSAGALKAMKEGAHYPDTLASGVKGMTDNPDFHGYFYRSSNNEFVNYIASYKYILRMGNSYGKGNWYAGVSGSDISGLTKNSENAIYSGFINMHNKIVTYSNPEYRKAFVYGIAMHSATDVFAHSVYYYSGGSWKRIKHPNADDTNVQPRRVTMAERVERNVLYRFQGKRGDVPIAHDFHAAKDTSGEFYVTDSSNKYYRTANLLKYANQMGIKDNNVIQHYKMLNLSVSLSVC